MGVDASPRSISPQRTRDDLTRLPPLMGQRLREATTHRMPTRNPGDFPASTYAHHEINGSAAVTSEVMLFILKMRFSGKYYALFLFHLETIFSSGNGIFMMGDAIEPDHITGVIQGVGADAQRRNPHVRRVAPRSHLLPSLKRLVGFRM